MEQTGVLNHSVRQRAEVLAQLNAWSIARAQGFLDGEMARRRGAPPSIFARVGIDDYCMGFRAAYFVRSTSQRIPAATPLGGGLEISAAAIGQLEAPRSLEIKRPAP